MTATRFNTAVFDSVQRVVLENGLTLLLCPDDSAATVAIVTVVKAGYFDETDDIVGIAHVLEHMFFKGTERRGVGEISKETKASGGYLNAHTIYDNTTYYAVLPASGFEAGLEIQADAYANSVIDGSELARELEVIIEEAKRKTDNPSAVATESLFELLHDSHRIRRWRIGREAELRTLTRDKLLSFYRNFYRPSNTILTIAGKFNPDRAVNLVQQYYGILAGGEPERKQGPGEKAAKNFRYRERSADISQTQLTFGWKTVPTRHPDTPALDMIGSLLAAGRASRLHRRLREAHLATTISAYNFSPTEIGVFVIRAECDSDKTIEAAGNIWHEVIDLREKAASADELERAKTIFEAQWLRRLEDAEGKANYLTEWEMLGDWKLGDEYFSRFMSLAPDEIQTVARNYFDPDGAGAFIYRPSAAPEIAHCADAFRKTLDEFEVPKLPALKVPSGESVPHSIHKPELAEQEAGVSVFHSRSGFPILTRRKPGSGIAYVELQSLCGSRDEDASRFGLTNLVVRTMLKGTARRTSDDIAVRAETLGARLGVSAGRDSSGWAISLPVHALEAGLELLADIFSNATLPEDRFENERTIAMSHIAMLRDDMYSYPILLASLAAFEGHPYGHPISGTIETMRGLSLNEARDWYSRGVRQRAGVLGVVADMEPDQIALLAAKYFGELQPAKRQEIISPKWPVEIRERAESRDKAQTAFAIAFPGVIRTDPRRFVAGMVANIASGLGGRFFEELRDRQSLAYTVHAFPAVYPAAGLFLGYIATSPEKENVARNGLLSEFERLRSEPVQENELNRAKEYAIGSRTIRQENGAALLEEMLSAWTYGTGLGELAEYGARVRAISPQEILDFAREFFDPSRRVEGIVRGY